MISCGESSICLEDVYRITTEAEIAHHYLGVTRIPCKINSPLRIDKNPSFGLFSPDGKIILWTDFSSGEHGNIFTLLSKMWGTSYNETLLKIYKEFKGFNSSSNTQTNQHSIKKRFNVEKGINNSILECKVREWKDYDIKYWESYGVPLKWLKYANVHPISHKIIIKNGQKYIFGADKYAYAFAEFKEGNTTLKIYQPFNKRGFKWSSKHDRSVISLWTKIPKEGDKVCICSSLKDALCLWANTGIPSLAIQGEGYSISDSAISELKRRFKNIYILLDNDKPGLKDAKILASKTGFTNIVLPNINGAKDISDLYLSLHDKKQFKQLIVDLFNK